jgi:hypothetical protein
MPKLLTIKRKKMNFMVDEEVAAKLEQLVPAGERSDFFNHAMNEALTLYGRRRAFEFFEDFRKKQKKLWKTDEITEFIRKDRQSHDSKYL